jgi:GDP-L-fucose synthase
MKILVTGGNGMVGNCIKDYIVSLNLDDKYEFVFSNRSLNNKYSLDLTDRIQVLDFFEKHKFSYIIHLAADVGGLYKNMNNNTTIFTNNIRMNENVLEACIKYNVNRGIFILSSCIFPFNPSKFPMDETLIHESPPHYSNEGYAYSKRMMHLQCNNFNKTHNTEFICLVPVNLYGPYDNFNPDDSHLLPGLIHRFHNTKLNNNKKFIAYGTGKPLRQMLYAPDFANIILDILLNKSEIKNDTIICCNNDEYTIYDIVKKLSSVMNISFDNVVWDNTKNDGCLKKTVSNTKFKKYYPNYTFTSFDEGIKQTYKWYKNNTDILRI